MNLTSKLPLAARASCAQPLTLLEIKLQLGVDHPLLRRRNRSHCDLLAFTRTRARAQRKKTFLGLDFSPSVAATAAIAADDDVTEEMGSLIPGRQLMICGRHRGGGR